MGDVWKTFYSNDSRPYYYNTATKQTQWIKPQEIVEKEKKLKAWEESLKSDPVWEKKRDRFGREVYYNKETKQTHEQKPYHWWTEEEKQAKKAAEDKKKQEEEEKKRKADEAREQRIKPALKKCIAELKEQIAAQSKVAETIKKIKESKDQALPLVGLIENNVGIAALYKDGKTFNLTEVYDSRRVPAFAEPGEEITSEADVRYGPHVLDILFHISRHWTDEGTSRKWELPSLRLIVSYLTSTFFLFENFETLPSNPMDALFDIRYYSQGLIDSDLDRSGYNDRRINPTPYLELSKEKQLAAETADEKKTPICSDEQWVGWWSKKSKAKEEMYRAIKLRALGYLKEYAVDTYDDDGGDGGEAETEES